MKPAKSKNSFGFSYVQCLIAIFIVALAFVAMMASFNTATKIAKRAKSLIVATNLAQEGLEEARNLGYANLSPGTTETIVEGIPPETRRITIVENIDDPDDGFGDTDYKKVTVSVLWYEENTQETVSLSTYISDHE